MGNSFGHRILVLPIWGHFTTSNAQLYPKSFLPQPTFPLDICFRKLVKDSSWLYCSPTVCWVHAYYSDCAHTRLCTCRPEHNLVLLLKKLSVLFFYFFSERARETDINVHIQRHRHTDRPTDWHRQGGSLNWNSPANLENQLSSSSALGLHSCSNTFSFLFYEFWMMELRSSLPTKLLPQLFKPKSTNSFRSTINNFYMTPKLYTGWNSTYKPSTLIGKQGADEPLISRPSQRQFIPSLKSPINTCFESQVLTVFALYHI